MNLQIAFTSRFKKDFKLMLKRGFDESLLHDAISKIVAGEKLPAKYKSHKLSGEYSDCWECHLLPDWLMIWTIDEKEEMLTLIRTGSHSDLFK
jgi:mRNA interferase YafQ